MIRSAHLLATSEKISRARESARLRSASSGRPLSSCLVTIRFLGHGEVRSSGSAATLLRFSSHHKRLCRKGDTVTSIDPFHHDVPAERDFGYAQAVKSGELIHVSGQLSPDGAGEFRYADDSTAQAQQTYANMDKVLDHYGVTEPALPGQVIEIGFIVDTPASARPRGGHQAPGERVLGNRSAPAARWRAQVTGRQPGTGRPPGNTAVLPACPRRGPCRQPFGELR
ncbi:RidA family protein [Streptomyces rimosus]|uniref:RidA family protein n=1 Tax=Streptomyces rimosus TaxID=1927 RepID=UPI00373AE73B